LPVGQVGILEEQAREDPQETTGDGGQCAENSFGVMIAVVSMEG
jgi:hypothetical protein